MGGIKVLELGVLSHSVMSDSHDPMACSPPDSSVHAIFQARILECCHFLHQVDLPNPGLNPCHSRLLHWQADSLLVEPPGKPPRN